MLLSFPLGMFAIVFGSIITAMVSVKRLGSFLQSPELQPDACTIMATPPQSESGIASPLPRAKLSIEQGDAVVTIRDGEFRWSKDAIEPTLENINIEVKSGELLGVLGRVGCGKVTFISDHGSGPTHPIRRHRCH
jgi:ATP-binding cassette subfamily C (CFTR/MRP) protein 1